MKKFGIREVCDVEFTKIPNSGNGPDYFEIDTAKMSTIEGASSTVYAQGGKGNNRQVAWEGDKTLTFTVEDALITLASFEALTGAERGSANGKTVYTVKSTSFAAYYSIRATTLVRDEEGVDREAIIKIPRAKLQTTLSLSMAPTGDPSTFSFTFDAFPDVNDNLMQIEIDYAEADTTATNQTATTTVYLMNGSTSTSLTTTVSYPVIEIQDNSSGTGSTITLTGTTTTGSGAAGDILSDGYSEFKKKTLGAGLVYIFEVT